MTRGFIIFFLSFISLILQAQEYKKISNPTACKNIIRAHHLSTQSIIADFSESIISDMFMVPQKGSGKIYYKQSQYIRWEHKEPKKKIILINGNSFRMNENGKELAGSKIKIVGKKIQEMILQMLTGAFVDEKDFIVMYYESLSQYKLVLTPKSNRMSKYISNIQLLFDKKSLVLLEMSMIENEKERIVYTFSNYQLNGMISDDKFSTF